ncbi:M81 family metallopeptidase [Lysinibacillus sp. Bpr_S20]|uniref:M81 family metallopeptidase n=1 Tax=Lysinibacillus sp. Bpr_S20 TaxID=2933964 RepID=UPI0020113E12|nr:M81 family metallopeptidase [Lysinibacillus sp. Bpr_S20]MCL1702474.1 M81 family metallopeptidase [Lysinibacillus sp. Bpr_S20]
MVRRIGIGMFYHESHSFVPYKTDIPQFENYGYFEGRELVREFRNTKTELGGFIDVLERNNDIEIVPLLCAAAIPSGIVTANAYAQIENQMLTLLQQEKPLDGLLLALHGAMVVEGLQDPEEQYMKKIRSIIGNIPMVITLDMHANIKESYLDLANVVIGYKTYPHIDMYETGEVAANALIKLLSGQQFKGTMKKLFLMPPSINMRTSEGPMHKLIERSKILESKEGIFNITILGGFPYSDVAHVGAGIIVTGTEEEIINQALDNLTSLYLDIKEEFLVTLPTTKEAVSQAIQLFADKPVALVDISDNPLSCGSADTTELMKEVLTFNIKDCLIGGIYDVESIEKCKEAGIGSKVQLQLGGKVNPRYGLPVNVIADVIAISDGVFYNSGPFQKNYRMDLKNAVHIKCGDVEVLLIGTPMSANDPEMFRHIGIEPSDKKLLVLKAKNHFRAAFEPIVGEIIYVDAPGAASNYLRNFPYKNVPTSIWPLNKQDY